MTLLKSSRNEQRAVICFFLWAKELNANEIHSEIRPVYGDKCFSNNVQSLLAAEKASLIRNDLASMCQFQTLFGALVCYEIHCTESSTIVSEGVCLTYAKTAKPEQQAMQMMTSLDNLQRYKTEGEAMLERIVTGDETWVYHYQPETKQASRQ